MDEKLLEKLRSQPFWHWLPAEGGRYFDACFDMEAETIPAGETRTVSFVLTEDDLAYWHLADGVTLGADGAYTRSAEAGEFRVWIAPNAAEGEAKTFTKL